jgi:hypothetical protein
MGQSTDLDQKLRPVADAIIRNEADLTISDENGYSACTRIFQIRHGLEYLEQFVYRYIDLLALHDMDTVDYWLITTLACKGLRKSCRCLVTGLYSMKKLPYASVEFIYV